MKDAELTPRQKLINLFSAMADFETEDAETYLRSEGLDPEQLVREGSVFMKNIHMRIALTNLVEQQHQYIQLLQDECGRGASFMFLHGMRCPESVVKQGEDFRAKICELKAEVKKYES